MRCSWKQVGRYKENFLLITDKIQQMDVLQRAHKDTNWPLTEIFWSCQCRQESRYAREHPRNTITQCHTKSTPSPTAWIKDPKPSTQQDVPHSFCQLALFWSSAHSTLAWLTPSKAPLHTRQRTNGRKTTQTILAHCDKNELYYISTLRESSAYILKCQSQVH